MRRWLMRVYSQPHARQVDGSDDVREGCGRWPRRACGRLEYKAVDRHDVLLPTIVGIGWGVVSMPALVGCHVRMQQRRRPLACMMRVAPDTMLESVQMRVRGRDEPDEQGQRRNASPEPAQHN